MISGIPCLAKMDLRVLMTASEVVEVIKFHNLRVPREVVHDQQICGSFELE